MNEADSWSNPPIDWARVLLSVGFVFFCAAIGAFLGALPQ